MEEIKHNREICEDLTTTASLLQELAFRLSNSEEVITGKFKKRGDIKPIFENAWKRIYEIIKEITKDDIYRDFEILVAKEILLKMRRYMNFLFDMKK